MQPHPKIQLQADSTGEIDPPLHLFGFQFDELTPTKVSGRLLVTEKCCQPFKVLHGGVSTLIAESLGSNGARLACGLKRVAGIQLTINHVNSATIGDLVVAEATPVTVGRTIQVWEVQLWKMGSSGTTSKANKTMISSSRVTVYCNMATPDHLEDSNIGLRKMVARSSQALAATVMAVLLAVAVVGNYTLAKDEVKHLYDEKPTNNEAEDKAKSWAGWAKEVVKEGLGIKPTHDEQQKNIKQAVPGTNEYNAREAENEGNEEREKAGEVKDEATDKATDLKDVAARKAREAKEAASEKASKIKDEVSGKTGDRKDEAFERASNVKNNAEERAGEMTESASERASTIKDMAAEKAGELKNAASGKAKEAKDRASEEATIQGKVVEKAEKLTDATLQAGEYMKYAKKSVPESFKTFSDKEKAAAKERVEDTEEKVRQAKEKVKEGAHMAKEKVGETLEAGKQKVGETLEAGKQKAAENYETAKGKVGETLDAAKDKAAENYKTAKEKAGETAGSTYDKTKKAVESAYDKTKKTAGDTYDKTKTAGDAYDKSKKKTVDVKDGVRGGHIEEL